MIQENEQEDDETYSTHSRSPSPYDSVSSDGDDEISALKGKKLLDQQNANAITNNVITTQPKLTTSKSYSPETETDQHHHAYNRSTSSSDTVNTYADQKSHLIKPPLPKPLDVKPVPRMRSAPPPPPTHRKSQNAPPRPTWCYLSDFLAEVKMVMCKVIVGDASTNKIEAKRNSEFYVSNNNEAVVHQLAFRNSKSDDHP